jgi:hypothetical protein
VRDKDRGVFKNIAREKNVWLLARLANPKSVCGLEAAQQRRLENYPFLTPAQETKKSTLCGASTCAILSRISNTIIKPIVFKGPLPYPGSVLGERPGCIDNAVTDLVP